MERRKNEEDNCRSGGKFGGNVRTARNERFTKLLAGERLINCIEVHNAIANNYSLITGASVSLDLAEKQALKGNTRENPILSSSLTYRTSFAFSANSCNPFPSISRPSFTPTRINKISHHPQAQKLRNHLQHVRSFSFSDACKEKGKQGNERDCVSFFFRRYFKVRNAQNAFNGFITYFRQAKYGIKGS